MLNIAWLTSGRQGGAWISFQAHYLLSNTALTSSLESPFKPPSRLHQGSLIRHKAVTSFCFSQCSRIPAGARGAFLLLSPAITDPTFAKGAEVYHNYYNWPVKTARGFLEGKKLQYLRGGKEVRCFTFFRQLTPQPLWLERVLAVHFPFFILVPRKITKFISFRICPPCPQTDRQ